MTNTVSRDNPVSADSTIEFRAYYVRKTGNKTGSFVVHPDEVARLNAWRDEHRVETIQASNRHPVTGEHLPAFQPVEKNLLNHVEEVVGIRPGQLCWVGYRIERVHGKAQMHTAYELIRPA